MNLKSIVLSEKRLAQKAIHHLLSHDIQGGMGGEGGREHGQAVPVSEGAEGADGRGTGDSGGGNNL